ncbi:sulfurtransferase TusA family protein [Nonomuraea sp. B1E8]|uniref:sulfurtransferase TusA family protein n=1 Tax=unclassified Nonomuraea TaxID=2593643 RepID=UPI00325D5548
MNDERAHAAPEDGGPEDGGAGDPAVPVVLDGGDRRCIHLLIELSRLVAGLPSGGVVHLIATDPAAPIDLPAWCHLTGHHYLGPLSGRDRPTYAIGVRADAHRTERHAPWRSITA